MPQNDRRSQPAQLDLVEYIAQDPTRHARIDVTHDAHGRPRRWTLYWRGQRVATYRTVDDAEAAIHDIVELERVLGELSLTLITGRDSLY